MAWLGGTLSGHLPSRDRPHVGGFWSRTARRAVLAVAAAAAIWAGGCQSAGTATSVPASPVARQNSAPAAGTAIPRPSFDAPVVMSAGSSMSGGAARPTAPAASSGTSSSAGTDLTPSRIIPTGVPRDWVPVVKPNTWYWIIIHHTATPAGALARINASHRGKGWEAAGYHFVIGNGTESADGQIEVGPRWPQQRVGAHTRSPDNRFNEHGIGIVLVGNFNETRPSARQLESAARLVAYLMKTYKVPPERVIGHRDASATQCPGRNVSIAQIRQRATQILANAGEAIPQSRSRLAGTPNELLRDVR
ncbi:MAG: peptidoglycan recognition family protein [Tepidisphaerales bacterium]